MDENRSERVTEIFLRAADLQGDARARFLDEVCAGDSDLRAEVESLLSHDRPTQALEVSPGAVPAPGSSIGPYKILGVLGEGGMGIVYQAEQTAPVHRRVALKVIKLGMDTRQVVARFEAERQALAMMDHPNIARVLDAGATSDGRPYFVMEYVRGVPVTDYCDRHNLPTSERLSIFIDICEGIQHAHQKGVIHRDLKPGNVLVEIRDDRPVPKIIDFGVAKAVDHKLTERTLFTELGQIIGTPEYMSPEQAEMTGLDIDTRTDVYSLGVLLYELITGMLPFDSKELRRAGFDEIRRRIREDTPHKPSTRLATLGDATGERAKKRATDPGSLLRACRGDLDWITMKALEKDRTRRYASASELAADLRRHIANEPVTAGPPSVGYRARKFVRRHRVSVAVTALLVALFLAGFAGTAYGLVRAVRAERQARLEGATAERMAEFMQEMFEISDPGESRGNDVRAREILDRAASRIRVDLAGEPELQARLMEAMGKVYRSLGLYGAARPLLEDAVGALERAYGANSAEQARGLSTLGGLLVKQGRGAEALNVLERADAVADRAGLPADDLARAEIHNNRGGAYRLDKKWDKALAEYEEALHIREASLGAEHPDVAKMLSNLGAVHINMGDLERAEQALSRSATIRERALGADHPDLAKTLNSLGDLHRRQRDYARAREAASRALAIQENVLEPEHPDLVNTLTNLGEIERLDGNPESARTYFERALAAGEPGGHPLVPSLRGRLAAFSEKKIRSESDNN